MLKWQNYDTTGSKSITMQILSVMLPQPAALNRAFVRTLNRIRTLRPYIQLVAPIDHLFTLAVLTCWRNKNCGTLHLEALNCTLQLACPHLSPHDVACAEASSLCINTHRVHSLRSRGSRVASQVSCVHGTQYDTFWTVGVNTQHTSSLWIHHCLPGRRRTCHGRIPIQVDLRTETNERPPGQKAGSFSRTTYQNHEYTHLSHGVHAQYQLDRSLAFAIRTCGGLGRGLSLLPFYHPALGLYGSCHTNRGMRSHASKGKNAGRANLRTSEGNRTWQVRNVS